MTDYRLLADTELSDLLRSGDQIAFTEIYTRYKALLYVFAYKRTGKKEEAGDLIHELFLQLWEKHASLQITGSLSAYLYTAVRNRIIDYRAKQEVAARYSQRLQEFLDQQVQPADYAVRQRQLEVLIEKEIAALPPKMRQVFELSRQAHLTRSEIAAQLGLSEETVKSHLHHALKILKGRIGPLAVVLYLLS